MASTSSRNTRLRNEQFIPIKGDIKRRAVDVKTGEVISRRQYVKQSEKIQYTPPIKTIQTRVQPQRATTTYSGKIGEANRLATYYKRLDDFIKTVNEKTKGLGFEPLTRNTARQSFEFKQMYKDYKNAKDREKGGKRHLALIYFGIIEEEDDYY